MGFKKLSSSMLTRSGPPAQDDEITAKHQRGTRRNNQRTSRLFRGLITFHDNSNKHVGGAISKERREEGREGGREGGREEI